MASLNVPATNEYYENNGPTALESAATSIHPSGIESMPRRPYEAVIPQNTNNEVAQNSKPAVVINNSVNSSEDTVYGVTDINAVFGIKMFAGVDSTKTWKAITRQVLQ